MRFHSNVVLGLLFVFASCTHQKPIQEYTQEELSQSVMEDSLMASSLHMATSSSHNCIKPFLAGMDEEHAQKFMAAMHESFKYEELYSAVSQKWMKAVPDVEMRKLAKEFKTKEWQTFNHAIHPMTQQELAELNKYKQQLENGTFDYKSKRTIYVASITDEAYILNLLKISNSEVKDLVSKNYARLPEKQKSAIEWFKKDLSSYEDMAKRQLFMTNYVLTLDMDEDALKKVAEIRSSEAYVQGRKIFEAEYKDRLQNFFEIFKKAL